MITNSQEYKQWLQEIQNSFTTTLTTLPSDEPRFIIDANSRTIQIPNEFAFISTQYEHNAETIYFEIDRYFDDEDLSNHTCVVQFINKNGQAQNEGIYPVTSMDIDSIDGKIIFGWEIKDNATQISGDIYFAVRFYSLDENGSFTYNLNTLASKSVILETINVQDITNGSFVASDLLEWIEKINVAKNDAIKTINTTSNEYLTEMVNLKNGSANAAEDAAQSAENAAASASESDATYQKVVEIEKTTTDKINQAGREQVENIETSGTEQLKILQEAAEGVVADREQIQQNASDIVELQNKNTWNLIAYRKLEEAVSGINISLDDAGKEFEYRNIRVLIPKLNLTSDGGIVWVYLVKRNTTNITSNHISFMAATGIPANDSILEMSGEILRNHLWIKSYRRVGTESPTFTAMSRDLNRTGEPMYQRAYIQSTFDAGTEIYVYGSN